MKEEKKALILDSREVAAALSTVDMFVGREINSTYGALAVAVPGELKGLYVCTSYSDPQNIVLIHGSWLGKGLEV